MALHDKEMFYAIIKISKELSVSASSSKKYYYRIFIITLLTSPSVTR